MQRGLANTRTADVASAAGVSQALLFYHFATKERLLAQAFAFAAEQDLSRLDGLLRSTAGPLDKLKRFLRLHQSGGRSTSWALWIDGWAEALRTADLERISRRLDVRRREVLTEIITEGVNEGAVKCEDPAAAAWRISAVIDGLAVQATVHERAVSRRQVTEWLRLCAARELGIDAEQLA